MKDQVDAEMARYRVLQEGATRACRVHGRVAERRIGSRC